VTETVWTQFYFSPRFRPNLSQKRLLEAGWLGKKTGRGFYDYRDTAHAQEPTKDIALGERIVDRILALLINEASDAIYRGIASPVDLETAMTKGVNYPKGLLAWGLERGFDRAEATLRALYDRTGDNRYYPNPQLQDWAAHAPTF
jgi:3-hydroxybutyryl-CoA dehydrogenase